MQTGGTSTASEINVNAGNKMASTTIEEHELKIMDVEGAVTVCEEPVMTIEVGDDSCEGVDNNNVSLMLAELETSLNDKSVDKPLDPLMEETMSAKVEPSEEEDNECNPYHDPMGLLSRMDSNPENDSQDDDDDDASADDVSSGISSKSRKQTKAERWLIWMKRWPWLLHEDNDGTYAYCLYCNVNLNVNGQTKFIKQHNLCMYHQEREKNYLAFKESEAKKKDEADDNEIKHEFGTNSYVIAMKEKRLTQVESFNDFNWERWLQEHSWLKRSDPQGTIGICKSCNVSMNVEFIYLRKRHESSKAHLHSQRQQGQDKSSRKRKRSASTSCDEVSQPPNQVNGDTSGPVVSIADGDIEAGSDPSTWCEFIPGTKYQQCRCTLCNIRMVITSYLRHCKTKAHCINLQAFQQKEISITDKDGVWAVYKQAHPWMTADPDDPMMAYCSVCCKRFMYGHSEIKRKAHENSEKHLAAVATDANETTAKVAAAATEHTQSDTEESIDDGNDEGHNNKDVGEGVDEDVDEDDEDDDEDEPATTSHKSSRGRTIHSKNKQVVRHYSWLCLSKDRKSQICKFCRIRFHNESGKARHEHSDRHKSLVKQFYKRRYARKLELRRIREGNKLEEKSEDDQNNTEAASATLPPVEQKPITVTPPAIPKALPATIRGKVLIWKERFPWLSYKRSEERPNYGWCKLCEVSVFLPSFKFASKHQRSTRHIRLRIERKRTALIGEEAEASTASTLSAGEAKHKAAMAELQAKYDWLEPDATEENYCHCRICETRLPIKLFYLRQHDTSRKHSENLEQLKANSSTNASPVANGESHAQQQSNHEAMTKRNPDQDTDDALSQKSDSSTGEPPLKRSRRSNEMKRIIRALRDSVGKRQDDRNQLELAKDMICSSFDIVTRLRNLERTQIPPPVDPLTTPQQPKSIDSMCSEPRHIMDLFFDSISATMKSLPSDLAAKGKAKIMQIVCDLEVEAMQRKAPICEPQTSSSSSTSPSTEAPVLEVLNNHLEQTDTISCSETLEDEELSDEPLANNANKMNSNKMMTGTANMPEVSVIATRREGNGNGSHNDNNSNCNPNPKTARTKTMPTQIRQPIVNNNFCKEGQSGVFRALPPTIQVTKIRPETTAQDSVRCVPLDKLTMTQRNNGSTSSKSSNDMNNSSSFLRNFRVANGNVSTGGQSMSKPTQIVMRVSGGSSGSGGGNVSSNGGSQTAQSQYQRSQQNAGNQRLNPSSR